MAIRDLIPWKKNPTSLLSPKEFEREPVRYLRRQMNRLFDDFFNPWVQSNRNWFLDRWTSFMPDVDVIETDKEYRVTVELPGIEQKDIELSLLGNTLIIKGEKKEEHESDNGNYYQAERSFGAFQRAIALPSSEVDQNAVKAQFKRGVLKITVPKKAEAQSKNKKIAITAG